MLMTIILGQWIHSQRGNSYVKRRIYFEAQGNVCCDARYNNAHKDDVKLSKEIARIKDWWKLSSPYDRVRSLHIGRGYQQICSRRC